MPGGAGTPGGYDGGSGSGSSADGTGAAYQDRIQQIAAAQIELLRQVELLQEKTQYN